LRPVVRHWRAQGYKIVVYLDDGILGASSYDKCVRLAGIVQKDLTDLGFLLAEEKCNWVPAQKVKWLGHMIDCELGEVKVTEERLIRTECFLSNMIEQVANGKVCFEAKILASVLGQIQSMKGALSFNVDIMTKFSFMCLNRKSSWFSDVYLDSDAFNELTFCLKHLRICNGQCLELAAKIDYVVYSDASATGFGAYVLSLEGSEIVGTWTPGEAMKSSSWREAEAVSRALRNYSSLLANKSVTWFCDCRNVAYIVQKGSMVCDLQGISRQIYSICFDKGIQLTIKWLPREENWYCDMLSKLHSDSDDWSVSDKLFTFLDEKWGYFDVDLFASEHNHKCSTYYSKVRFFTSSGVNAFDYSWKRGNCWMVPPPILALKTVNKILREEVTGVLIVPKWLVSPFWPVLVDLLKDKRIIKEYFEFSSNLIEKGRGKNAIFGNVKQEFTMVAFRFG